MYIHVRQVFIEQIVFFIATFLEWERDLILVPAVPGMICVFAAVIIYLFTSELSRSSAIQSSALQLRNDDHWCACCTNRHPQHCSHYFEYGSQPPPDASHRQTFYVPETNSWHYNETPTIDDSHRDISAMSGFRRRQSLTFH